MEIKEKYVQKHLHEMAIEQLTDEYRDKGYVVSKEEPIGRYQADLIVRKGAETIVIEVKAGRLTPARKKAIAEIGNYVKAHNLRFLVVVAAPPQEKKLEVLNIENLLEQYIINELPHELDELSQHTRVKEISDIDIDELTIDGNIISISGNGVISVNLQSGSDSDITDGNGNEMEDSFPFVFEIGLAYDHKKELKIHEVNKLEVDTSSFLG